ncbi:type II toxin-antitoxin system Phd/YefM family antitoxin [Rhodococcus xishaensis]|uniref:Antitoxin n=1 Tax=Rhodococcus xishaensis TaxID=2487364 RepID=A0A438ANX1_9NOCA|nr:type II toxin-antitoxin system prevent-host-death family antitoxin [Rhodococcus xishaensis]RVW00201.1 type II toxin-antitoxin system prevent-host-death family antitoxin [Rhodococcus xishaensis]
MAVTANVAKQKLEKLIQQVNDDCLPIEIVTDEGSAVLVPKDHFDSLEETAYLFRNPVMAERLMQAYERFKRGEFIERELIEE